MLRTATFKQTELKRKRPLCEYLEEQDRQLAHENILLKVDMKRINEFAFKGEEFHVLKNLLQRIADSQITKSPCRLQVIQLCRFFQKSFTSFPRCITTTLPSSKISTKYSHAIIPLIPTDPVHIRRFNTKKSKFTKAIARALVDGIIDAVS
ncbi:hypothetical protein [Paenibacillus sp. Soil787]|uniref:hypothetical protein n=1 Tax=Paenibacillus sp. Soil787 TaxID=1736411 RepID=UPI0006FCBEC1|nr:hypothetical protein [Paenibacillus sp. Soil787]KRF35898.1 hypothetical protein ASG93_25805 [Paenibacillus sp. Soil787]